MLFEVEKKIEDIKTSLKGRKINSAELFKVESSWTSYPAELLSILKRHAVIGQTFSMPEDVDLSEMGVELKWMNIEEQLEESLEYYPGKVALKKGFLPIGKCLSGSGDPYFLKIDELVELYRVPHDSVRDDELDSNLIEHVGSLVTLFDYVE
ncbi:MAG: hypothetical protein AAF600_21795 [Bacteroidota bacterium]